jgi:hypothetical protein
MYLLGRASRRVSWCSPVAVRSTPKGIALSGWLMLLWVSRISSSMRRHRSAVRSRRIRLSRIAAIGIRGSGTSSRVTLWRTSMRSVVAGGYSGRSRATEWIREWVSRSR